MHADDVEVNDTELSQGVERRRPVVGDLEPSDEAVRVPEPDAVWSDHPPLCGEQRRDPVELAPRQRRGMQQDERLQIAAAEPADVHRSVPCLDQPPLCALL
ncbi:MAG: hypothetical protein OXG37_14085 [Actinomycetia bacterium]|nr:hypothetical protein [Actinomycetes bacterium]